VNRNLVEYYAARAGEYEDIYQLPERQGDLAKLSEILVTVFQGRNVLEIACGTGYWSRVIARRARSIVACDYNREMLDIARQKDYGCCRVSFLAADAYVLANISGTYSAGLGGFWWSHIPYERMGEFLTVFHAKLQAGAVVVFMDNNYVAGSSTDVSRKDEQGNTYQKRKLRNGDVYEVLKNYPDESQIRHYLRDLADELEFISLSYFWLVKYTKS
jgi:SAM-dependent methyltransferase